MAVDWSELSGDILLLISNKLFLLSDYHSLSLVCKSWHFSAMQAWYQKDHSELQLPLLMLPFDQTTNTCNFFNIRDCEMLSLHLPELHNRYCCSSSHGWLITVDENLDIYLLNPLTRSQVQLPTHPFQSVYTDLSHPAGAVSFLKKAVLSSSPSSSEECIILGLFGKIGRLSLCRVGEHTWNHIADSMVVIDHDYYFDVTCYNGEIYTVCEHGFFTSAINVFRFGQEKKEWFLMIQDRVEKVYFVESCGDLLLAVKPMHIYMFHVFKLDQKIDDWVKVKHLGDHSLFLGHNHGTSHLVDGDSSVISRNCIYFVDYYWDSYPCSKLYNFGVFNMEKKKAEINKLNIETSNAPPVWFQQLPMLDL
ncbi:F-box domain-containing protein [Dioscorea alata]|uniref:F-box domain-containing protein n=1 Tax=Dioscorea alata TaxID=55571 RepID=A0ACB7UQU4_DIOAL|nr:F-box domain-containing protein [Dioscorea alata]